MSNFPKPWAIGVINKMQDYFESRFESTFKKRIGETDQQYVDRLVSTACEVLEGLNPDQIKVGLAKMNTAKFCPVLPEFRNWCVGGDVNSIHASYRNRNAAIANIEAWLCNDTTTITNAEREAYNRCYTMFNDLKWNYSDRQKFHTYEAFKGFYDEVVKNLVENGVSQCDWVKPVVIESKRPIMKSLNYLDEITPEQLAKREATQDKIEMLIAGDMSLPMATMQVLKEERK